MSYLRLFLAVALTAGAAEMALIEPPAMVSYLSSRPAIFYVGPNVLYRSKHIPASVYAGFASRPEGIVALKTAVEKLPRDRAIVIYCGCCPWDRCPNIKPAMEQLHEMGFTNVKALHLADSFKADWIDKGYPVEAGSAN